MSWPPALTIAAANSALWHFDLSTGLVKPLLRLSPWIGLLLAVDLVTFFKRDPYFFARRSPFITVPVYLFLIYAIFILGVAGREQFIYFAF